MESKAREWWIDTDTMPNSAFKTNQSEYNYTRVIEHAAYIALEQKLALAVEALEHYAKLEDWPMLPVMASETLKKLK